MLTRFFLFALLASAFSYAYSNFSIVSTVDQGGNSELNGKIIFNEYFGKEFSLYISGDIQNVTAIDSSGLALPVNISKSGNYSRISVIVPADYAEFEIRTPYLTAKEGSEWRYELDIKTSVMVDSLTSSVSLPSGSKISATNGAVEAGDSGLIVVWDGVNLAPSKKATMFVTYTIETETNQMTMIIVLGIIFVVGALINFYLTRERKQVKTGGTCEGASGLQADRLKNIESHQVFKTLDENDKEIIREIVRQGGKTTQAHLNLYTHIAKATLSRRLASLESKGIISRSQKGIRKLISLTDALK